MVLVVVAGIAEPENVTLSVSKVIMNMSEGAIIRVPVTTVLASSI